MIGERPRKEGVQEAGKASSANVIGSSDNQTNAEDIAYAESAVLREADSIVLLEVLAIEALRLLSTEQLRSLIWVGLLDKGWSRLNLELERRGEVT